MKHKKLQILVPQYKENEEVISFLLDSIECQKEIDKNDIGVIICSDGGEYKLNEDFLKKYSYNIKYVICEHRGVSATRNSALLLSDSDYVMFCDADDGFCNIFAIKIIFENIKISEDAEEPFDILSSKFYREINDKQWTMDILDHNTTFIHGLVYRRDFLIQNNIFFNEKIWANEDCFFNIVSGFFAKNKKLLNLPIYCWKANPKSVTSDSKFIMKTLHQLLYSNDSVLEVMQQLNLPKENIASTAFDVICKIYLDMNKPEWHLPENKEYKDITLKTLKWYLNKRGNLCGVLSDADKKNILQKTRGTAHYGNIENITFNDFIKAVMSYE